MDFLAIVLFIPLLEIFSKKKNIDTSISKFFDDTSSADISGFGFVNWHPQQNHFDQMKGLK